jgi:broad specificity phosphatase PhoE
MATFHLVRHGSHAEVGHVLSGRSDIGLSHMGRRQGQLLCERFAPMPVESLHASPRARALQTAHSISLGCAVPIQVDDALDEIDFGDWTGRAFAELDEDPAWSRWNDARGSCRPPDGETMAAATDRAVKRLAEIAQRTIGPVVMVTHCDIIRGIIAHYLGLDLDRLLRFEVDPASVSRLSVGSWGGRVLSVNECWT